MRKSRRPKVSNERNKKNCARIEAFSDGVFAIAATLLVLDIINVRHPTNTESLFDSFINQWPAFVAFLIGFLSILVCWINHHTIFIYINRFDSKMLWINGFLLLLVTFIPFPTAILAEHLKELDQTALSIYGFTFVLLAFSFDRLWTYAYKHKFLNSEENVSLLKSIKLVYRFSVVLTAFGFLISFISVIANIILVSILFIVYAFPIEFANLLNKYELRKVSK